MEREQTTIRLPAELKDQLQKEAEQEENISLLIRDAGIRYPYL